jgi:hypothetical protein
MKTLADSIMRYAGHAGQFWHQDIEVVALTAAAIGVASHVLYWSRGLKAPQSARIFYFHLIAFALVSAGAISSDGLVRGMLASWAVCGSYLVALFTSMTIYRVFFHRLSRFPGPFPARVSKMYSLWLARNGKTYQEIVDICDKYGDIVRTGRLCSV